MNKSLHSVILTFVTLTVLVTGCAPASTPIPPSLTPLPSIDTSTKQTTVTPAPSETAVPNIPEGATGKDAKGKYIQTKTTESGNMLTYTYDTERKAWFRPIIDGVPLFDLRKGSNDIGFPDQGLMTVNVDQKILNELTLPTITHPTVSEDFMSTDFTTAIFTDLQNVLLARGFTIKDLFSQMINGNYYLAYTTKEGPQKWILGPNKKVIVNIRGGFDALKAGIANNGFSEVKDLGIYGPANSFIVKSWTDKQGNQYCDISPEISADKWTKKQIIEMILFCQMNVIEGDEDQTNPQASGLLGEYILTWGLYPSAPYFEFGPPP